MGFLASAGLLAILFVIVMLILKHLSFKEHEPIKPRDADSQYFSKIQQRSDINTATDIYNQIEQIKKRIFAKYGELPDKVEYQPLIKYSKKCHDLISQRNSSLFEGPNRISVETLHKRCKRILKDPLEFWPALEKYLGYLDAEEKRLIKETKREELFIKYNEIIFGVFDINRFLSKDEIISRIQNKFGGQKSNAEEIFDLWYDNELIFHISQSIGEKRTEIYEISILLEGGAYESDSKITRPVWLAKNNKHLIDGNHY